jgi:hypothetical protein
VLTLSTTIAMDSRIYPLLGIIVETCFVVACLVLIVFIVWIWRIAMAALIFLVISALLLVSETFMLAFWAELMKNFQSPSPMNILEALPSNDVLSSLSPQFCFPAHFFFKGIRFAILFLIFLG